MSDIRQLEADLCEALEIPLEGYSVSGPHDSYPANLSGFPRREDPEWKTITAAEVRRRAVENYPEAHVEIYRYNVTGSAFFLVAEALGQRRLGFEVEPELTLGTPVEIYYAARIFRVGQPRIPPGGGDGELFPDFREAVCRAALAYLKSETWEPEHDFALPSGRWVSVDPAAPGGDKTTETLIVEGDPVPLVVGAEVPYCKADGSIILVKILQVAPVSSDGGKGYCCEGIEPEAVMWVPASSFYSEWPEP